MTRNIVNEVIGVDTAARQNKKMKFKTWVPFTDGINEIKNTHADNAKDLDVVIPMYNLIEYSDICSKTSTSLLRYYRDEPVLDDNDNLVDFYRDNITDPFKFKAKLTGQTNGAGTKYVKTTVPLKYLSNF